MEYLTSRRLELPATAEDWRGKFHFNLWRTRQWPYRELETGVRLYWYESPLHRLSWETQVIRVERFEYDGLDKAIATITREFGPLDETQAYMDGKPDRGYALVYASKPIRRVDATRPDDFSMPRLGWLRFGETARKGWLL